MKQGLLFLAGMLMVPALFSQTTFQTVYGTASNEISPVIEARPQGGFAIAASTDEHDPSMDFLLIVTEDDGDTVFTRKYDYGVQRVVDLKCTNDGGYVICGYWRSANWPFQHDVMLLKVDASGNVVWCNNYTQDSAFNEHPEELIQTSDGGFAVVGSVDSASFNYQGFILKVNSAGVVQWMKSYGLSLDFSVFTCITEGQNGELIAAGYTYHQGHSFTIAVRVDAASNLLWFHAYKGLTIYIPHSVVEHSSGNIYLGGSAAEDSAHSQGFIMMLTGSGSWQWTKCYTLNLVACNFQNMILSSAGDLVIVGRRSFSGGMGFVVKSDPNGNTTLATEYLYSQPRYYNDIAEADDGGFALTAAVQSVFTTIDPASVVLIKTTSSLDAQCGINVYSMNDVNVVLSDSVYIPVEDSGGISSQSTLVIHTAVSVLPVCALVGIDDVHVQALSVYPNPASGFVMVEGALPGDRMVVYNAAGAMVRNEQLSSQSRISLEELADGLYFYRIESAEGVKQSGKIILD